MIDQFKLIYYYYYEFYYNYRCPQCALGVCAGVHGCAWVGAGVRGYARVCAGIRRSAQCGRMCTGVRKCALVCNGVHWCALVCAEVRGCLRVCVWDDFSEYLLENRVPTSAALIRILYEFLIMISNEIMKYYFLYTRFL